MESEKTQRKSITMVFFIFVLCGLLSRRFGINESHISSSDNQEGPALRPALFCSWRKVDVLLIEKPFRERCHILSRETEGLLQVIEIPHLPVSFADIQE